MIWVNLICPRSRKAVEIVARLAKMKIRFAMPEPRWKCASEKLEDFLKSKVSLTFDKVFVAVYFEWKEVGETTNCLAT